MDIGFFGGLRLFACNASRRYSFSRRFTNRGPDGKDGNGAAFFHFSLINPGYFYGWL